MPVSRAIAHCRADLAGGTLDIWPLGLLHAGSRTVNVALGLAVQVELAVADRWSVEQNGETLTAETLDELRGLRGGELVALVAAELGLPPCRARLASDSPRGAGLGASSALTVALLAAAEPLVGDGRPLTADRRASLARDLEARLMSLPTGRQDHFPAQLGGALVIEHRAGGERWRRLEVDLGALGERLLIAYSGVSHFSAGNNWEVIRRRLDGDSEVSRRLDAIALAARDAEQALIDGDWNGLGTAMSDDWAARRGLADGITTPEIEGLLEAARGAGALGGKVCGAGGGGSIAVLVAPDRRAGVADALVARGAQILATTVEPSALEQSSSA